MWAGNSLLGNYLNNKLSWTEYPVKRFIVGFIVTVSYSLLTIIGLMEAFQYTLDFDFGDGYRFSVYLSVAITIVVSLFLHGRGFLLAWREAAKDAEKLQKESIVARYESLKSQVNPHFLFNSLNALTNLVYEDQDKAVRFIKQLSEVYRYVLDTRDRELVSLNEELEFLEAYLFLQKIRFGDNLKTEIHVANRSSAVAPLALQMLIENAIKHNVISTEDPLIIRIVETDNFISVENNLQKKTTLGEVSSGIGLDNIRKRYEFLSNKKVEVLRSADKFTVRLPVIENVN
jgi:LytS/YehU family sensor histidine kinase